MGKVEQRKIKKLQEQAKKEFKKEFSKITSLNKELGINSLSESLKIKGLNKVGKLSLEQSFNLLKQSSSTILTLTGAFKDGCPSDLASIVNQRNNIVNNVNNLTTTINNFTTSVNGVGTLIQSLKTSGESLQATRTANSIASKAAPTPPGLPGFLSSVGDDIDIAIDKTNKKIEQNTQKLEYNSSFLNFSLGVLKKIKENISSLDSLITGCSSNTNLIPTNELLNQLENQEQDTTYKGFTFEIVKVPFNKTLDRNKAVALNKSNIPIAETELSFTLEPNVLIEQLKNKIDLENLEAD